MRSRRRLWLAGAFAAATVSTGAPARADGDDERRQPPAAQGPADPAAVAKRVRELLEPYEGRNHWSPHDRVVRQLAALGREAIPELIAVLQGGDGRRSPAVQEFAGQALARLV